MLGRANRFLARHADRLALSFAATERVPTGRRPIVTGNPVRPAIAALATLPYAPPTDTIRLLVLGGSLGARVFSDVVPAALRCAARGAARASRVVQQCRAEDLERVRAAYDRPASLPSSSAFFPDVAERLAVGASGDRPRRRLHGRRTGGRRPARDPGAAARCDRRSSVGQCARAGRGRRRLGDPAAGVLSPAALRDRLAALLAAPDDARPCGTSPRARHGPCRCGRAARRSRRSTSCARRPRA